LVQFGGVAQERGAAGVFTESLHKFSTSTLGNVRPDADN
jgi:hypothetical protein